MSDRGLSLSPPPAKKRKSTSSAGPSKKRTKTKPDPFAHAKILVQSVLTSPDSFELPSDDTGFRELVLNIAQYARSLEGSVAVAGSSGNPAPAPKTAEEIAAEVDRVSNLINRGIAKQMAWKPSCKQGRARYAFDGVCADPRVFGALFKLAEPPKWKQKKFTQIEFEDAVGSVEKSARYSNLRLTGDVNVRWNPDTGEFKMSGSYGV